MTTFEIASGGFFYGGEAIQLISGAMHYFRTVPEHWEDRLLKLKACGLNAVETYVPWNAHERRQGEFDFTGILDLGRFIRIAQALDLLVIVRPSPYICAEWDFGGLPAWLLADPGMRVRCMHTPYLEAVARYYDRLMPLLAPLQCTAGGPIVAMQIENEYGSYGTDKAYLQHLESAMRRRGIDVPLFTSDGAENGMLQGGTLPHIFKTVNFGERPTESFEKLREYQATGPSMCMEFWIGLIHHWGKPHQRRSAELVAGQLDEMLASGASVNFYMFHGGTNFGFSSGANFEDGFLSTITSYEYDSPLNEAGDPTPKYFAMRDVIGKYRALPDLPVPPSSRKQSHDAFPITGQALLFDNLDSLSRVVKRTNPEPMEMLGQSTGFILYRTYVSGPRFGESLVLQEVRDRALVFVDGELQGTQYRNDPVKNAMKLTIPPDGATVDILVENMGHINYGPYLIDRKGITEGVRLNNQFLHGWEIHCLPLDDLASLRFQALSSTDQPAFYRAEFEAAEAADTFVALKGWTKGVCFVNGFNLGRYWDSEPRRNLYLPGPLLKIGINEIVLFELHGCPDHPGIELVDHAEAEARAAVSVV